MVSINHSLKIQNISLILVYNIVPVGPGGNNVGSRGEIETYLLQVNKSHPIKINTEYIPATNYNRCFIQEGNILIAKSGKTYQRLSELKMNRKLDKKSLIDDLKKIYSFVDLGTFDIINKFHGSPGLFIRNYPIEAGVCKFVNGIPT